MAKNASKAKGNSWELNVAKTLSSLFNESFIRTPSSGGYIGGKNSARKQVLHEGQIRAMKGDIIPPMHWKHFNVECKSYAEFPFHQLFSNNPVKLLDNWIDQILEVADLNDINLIIMKFNRKGSYIAFEEKHLQHVVIKQHLVYTSESKQNWVFCDFDHFITNNVDYIVQCSTGA